MFLFLVSVGMLFGATLIATLVVRFAPASGQAWHGIDLPWELGLSTLLLAVSSATCEAALRRIRRGDCRGLHRWLTATLIVGLVFLLVQAWCWSSIVRSIDWTRVIDERTLALAAWLVVVLTVVHALHVIGGLVPMAIARRRSALRRYTASQHAGVERVRTYWHFLGAVWVILLLTMLVALPSHR